MAYDALSTSDYCTSGVCSEGPSASQGSDAVLCRGSNARRPRIMGTKTTLLIVKDFKKLWLQLGFRGSIRVAFLTPRGPQA